MDLKYTKCVRALCVLVQQRTLDFLRSFSYIWWHVGTVSHKALQRLRSILSQTKNLAFPFFSEAKARELSLLQSIPLD